MMKKLLLILLIVIISFVAIISLGCSKSKLSGTYEGTLPAADGPGLQTLITFNADGTFHMEETFLEKDVEPRITDGKWILNEGIITFTAGDYKFEYKIISGKEIRWAPDGKEITGTDLNWSLLKK
jgi:copper homeostasis protein (lipoprotein)